jgi:hypothetical protein
MFPIFNSAFLKGVTLRFTRSCSDSVRKGEKESVEESK